MTTAPGNPTKGILLVVGATVFFALADTVTKHLTTLYPVSIVMLLRYAVNVALMLVFLYPTQRAALWHTRRTQLVTLRALCLCAGSLTMAMALRVMPVGETVAIVYLSPFLVMLLAAPLLGERVSMTGWIGSAMGFTGVLLIVHPGGGLDRLGVVLSLVNAGFATAYHLLTRLLARTETTYGLLFNTAAVGVIVFALLSIGQWHGPMPGATDIGLMLLLGVLMTGGHYLFTSAYREAPVSLLAPITYLHLFWAGGFGWLIFNHIPDQMALTGMALVMIAGIAIALRARFAPPIVE